MDTILFLVTKDKKFTNEIIEYFEGFFPEYKKYYCVIDRRGELCFQGIKNLFVIKSYIEFISNKDLIHIMSLSDKIIINGLFTFQYVMTLKSKYLSKTYIQFWGGDFYRFRYYTIKNCIDKIFVNYCVKRCAAVITLVDSEIKEFKHFFPYSVRFFSVPVCDGLKTRKKQEMQREKAISKSDNSNKYVIVGNSATPENRHEELFEILESSALKDSKIICPLSYGNREYADKIETLGKKIWGDSFVALRSFIKYEDYVDLLMNCQVGIYYHNRQQGMGNISSMINLGKKVYISRKSPLWEYYKSNGFLIGAVEDLPKLDMETIFSWTKDEQNSNFKAFDIRRKRMDNIWRTILQDSLKNRK